MADGKKNPGADTLGIVFKNQKPKEGAVEASPMSELYNRSLASISQPGKKDVRVFNVENAFSGKSIEAGTIVSDRRKDRPTFFQNITDAFSEWSMRTKMKLGYQKKSPATTNETVFDEVSKRSEPSKQAITPKQNTTPKETSGISEMRTMKRDASGVQGDATPTIKSHAVQKIRTFKSDAAYLRPDAVAEKASPIIPAQETETLLKKETAVATIVLAPKKEIPVLAPDMRATMIAPDIHTRLKGSAASFVSTTKKDTPAPVKERLEYAFHIPEVLDAHKTQTAPIEKSSGKISEKKIGDATKTSSWTHTTSDALPHKEDILPPITTSVYHQPEREIDTPMRESVVPILPHETRSIQAEVTLPATAEPPMNIPIVESTPSEHVKPTWEPTPSALSTPTATTSEQPESVAESMFHTDSVQTVVPPAHNKISTSFSHSGSTFIRFAIRILLVLIGVGGLVILGAYLFVRTETEPSPITPIPGVEQAPIATSAEILLSEEPRTFLTRVARTVSEAPSGVTEFPVYTGEPLRNASAQEFFAHIETSMLTRAVRTLEDEFILGSITTTRNEPFIVIRSNNFDAIFAGLLAWEPTMQQELAPLFGNARSETAPFADAVSNNKSIRILRDTEGREILLYSFINERTVVITASGEALAELIGRF